MEALQFEIARFLVEKAKRGTRATYQQVGEAVGWNHPTGRGLGHNLEVSRAVPPASSPYWVGETDGPKHLYILELTGDIGAYLGRSADQIDGMSIIKVGFSKSPLSRRDQIQGAYPLGQFKWVVRFPANIPDTAPYPNARVAIVGEDAMKQRLVDEGAEILGGEFFLAEEWLIHNTWTAGKYAAEHASTAEPSS
jgi:hypothetical protein